MPQYLLKIFLVVGAIAGLLHATTLSGVVTDTLSGTEIAGAIVEFRSGVGSSGITIATATTNDKGVYSFQNLSFGGMNGITVRAAGYLGAGKSATSLSGEDGTINVALIPIRFGTLKGKVTADALNGTALNGVSVALSSNGGSAETVISDADGNYVLEKVQIMAGFTLRASKSGCFSKSFDFPADHPCSDTFNFFIARMYSKNIKVVVFTTADSSALAGASVVFTGSGITAFRTTDAVGEVLVENVFEGTSRITISAAGFTALTRSFTVNAVSDDSVRYYLGGSPLGTKTLCGTVTDSTTGARLAGVNVFVGTDDDRFFATITGSDGAYTITGIPVMATYITLTSLFDNYSGVYRRVNLGVGDEADTTKADAKLFLLSTSVVGRKPVSVVNGGKPFVGVTTDGHVKLFNFAGSGMVQLFALNGKLISRTAFAGRGSSGVVVLPTGSTQTASILKITGSDGTRITRMIVDPGMRRRR